MALPLPLGWPLSQAPGITELAYTTMRERILRGELEPGALLRQEELSRALGVSRTPVREALMRLVSDGYVEHLPRRGFRVAAGRIADLIGLYPILVTLERLAAETALARVTPARVMELERLNGEMRRAIARDDARGTIGLNQRFHRLLYELSDNSRLIRLLDELSAEIMRLEVWSFANEIDRAQTLHDHAEIVAALRREDYSGATAILTRDRLSAYEDYTRTLGQG